MDDLLESLIRSMLLFMMGVFVLISHAFVDAILKAVLYYILTLFEGAGIPVPMTYINALSPVDEALLILGIALLLSAPIPPLIFLYRTIKEMRDGTYI